MDYDSTSQKVALFVGIMTALILVN